jgi:hypothetical protein
MTEEYIVIRAELGDLPTPMRYVPARKIDETHACPVGFASVGVRYFKSAKNARREIRRTLNREIDGLLWTVDNRLLSKEHNQNIKLIMQGGHVVPVMRVR